MGRSSEDATRCQAPVTSADVTAGTVTGNTITTAGAGISVAITDFVAARTIHNSYNVNETASSPVSGLSVTSTANTTLGVELP